MALVKIILFPFACLYGLATGLRNWLFELGFLPSVKYDLPVIAIGNLSAGGTGKTPHTEYLVRLLSKHFRVAILSRGYKRKTRGFILVSEQHSEPDIGDEPMQYFKKFPDITLAVDHNRRRGISRILAEKPQTQVILLDDAFQHRYVKPGKSILLTDYHHLYTDDFLLPTGLLRETARGAKRADMIIVTKTPRIFSPITRRQLVKTLKPKNHQKIYYSYIAYDEPIALNYCKNLPKASQKYNYIIMFAGVANSYPFQEYLKGLCNELIVINFNDHHQYRQGDLEKIAREYESILSKDKVIFTTEKDAARIDNEIFAQYLDNLPVYYIPIRIRFHECDESRFDKMILDYVQKSYPDR
jgi:tetraacyldisaccharide 4'-kinase